MSVLAPQSLLAARPGDVNSDLSLDSKTNEELLVKDENNVFLPYSSELLQKTLLPPPPPHHLTPCVTLIRQTLLNKTRTNVSMAFQSLQKITLHTLQDYVAHVVSEPLLSGVEPRLTSFEKRRL